MDEEVDWGVEEEDFDPWAVQSNSRNENGRAIGSGSGFEGNGAGLAAKEEEKGRIGAGEGHMQIDDQLDEKFAVASSSSSQPMTTSLPPTAAASSSSTPFISSGPTHLRPSLPPSQPSAVPQNSTPSIRPPPPGWIIKTSRNKNTPYYYHPVLRITSWERPPTPPLDEEEGIEEPSTPPLPAATKMDVDSPPRLDVMAEQEVQDGRTKAQEMDLDVNIQAERSGDGGSTKKTLLTANSSLETGQLGTDGGSHSRSQSRDHHDTPPLASTSPPTSAAAMPTQISNPIPRGPSNPGHPPTNQRSTNRGISGGHGNTNGNGYIPRGPLHASGPSFAGPGLSHAQVHGGHPNRGVRGRGDRGSLEIVSRADKDREVERERQRESDIERERLKEIDIERERQRESERKKERDINRESERKREVERDRGKSGERVDLVARGMRASEIPPRRLDDERDRGRTLSGVERRGGDLDRYEPERDTRAKTTTGGKFDTVASRMRPDEQDERRIESRGSERHDHRRREQDGVTRSPPRPTLPARHSTMDSRDQLPSPPIWTKDDRPRASFPPPTEIRYPPRSPPNRKRSGDAMDVDRPHQQPMKRRGETELFADQMSDRYRGNSDRDRAQQRDGPERERNDLRREREEDGPRYGQAPNKRAREDEVSRKPFIRERHNESPPRKGRDGLDHDGHRGSRDSRRDDPPHQRSSRNDPPRQRSDRYELPLVARDVRLAEKISEAPIPPFVPLPPPSVYHRLELKNADRTYAMDGLDSNYAPVKNSRWKVASESSDSSPPSRSQGGPSAAHANKATPYGNSRPRTSVSDAFPDAAKEQAQNNQVSSASKPTAPAYAPITITPDDRFKVPAPPAVTTSAQALSESESRQIDRSPSTNQRPNLAVPSGPAAQRRSFSSAGNNGSSAQKDLRADRGPPTGPSSTMVKPQGQDPSKQQTVTEKVHESETAAPAPARPAPYINPARAHLVPTKPSEVPPPVQSSASTVHATPSGPRNAGPPTGPKDNGHRSSQDTGGFDGHRSFDQPERGGGHHGGRAGRGLGPGQTQDSGWNRRPQQPTTQASANDSRGGQQSGGPVPSLLARIDTREDILSRIRPADGGSGHPDRRR